MLLDFSTDSCTTVNCGSVRVTAVTNGFNTNNAAAGPWVAQTFVSAGQCLRLDTTFQTTDLEMVVVAPNGTFWRVDDRGGSLLPLVVIDPAPVTGWYTVYINHFGLAGGEHEFDLLYGRYTHLNSGNCASPTAPQVAPQVAKGG